MPLLTKILFLAIVGVLSFFGLTSVFQFSDSGSPSVPGITQTDVKVPLSNETIRSPQADDKFSLKNWVQNIPLDAIKDALAGGLGRLVEWLSQGVYAGLNYFIHAVFPSTILPIWIGTVVVVLLFAILFYLSWNALWNWGHGISVWVILIIFAVFLIAIVLSLLNLL